MKRSGESFRQWVPTNRVKHSNPELLALDICRAMAVFVVRGGVGGPRVVPGGSPGRGRGSQGRARMSQGRPRGSQGRAQGIPEIPGGSGDVPGIPGILFINVIP